MFAFSKFSSQVTTLLALLFLLVHPTIAVASRSSSSSSEPNCLPLFHFHDGDSDGYLNSTEFAALVRGSCPIAVDAKLVEDALRTIACNCAKFDDGDSCCAEAQIDIFEEDYPAEYADAICVATQKFLHEACDPTQFMQDSSVATVVVENGQDVKSFVDSSVMKDEDNSNVNWGTAHFIELLSLLLVVAVVALLTIFLGFRAYKHRCIVPKEQTDKPEGVFKVDDMDFQSNSKQIPDVA